ncbi:unnamed protein product [Allacma fusca]|uniref:Uncharacterized protein n=1 Tax=Allacma fusca TaxID=39272 RepID=A0A8J2JMN3_9HEXA|nr:unnamed protein product [Allacma fusca]
MVFHLLFLLSLLTDKADPGTVKPQIMDGEDARSGEFPWMISIQGISILTPCGRIVFATDNVDTRVLGKGSGNKM